MASTEVLSGDMFPASFFTAYSLTTCLIGSNFSVWWYMVKESVQISLDFGFFGKWKLSMDRV